ncbi:hypothetical protein GQ54DRAFT_79439 [Martensiomyces pterosporus]|nr:hypothetical protein GQ54DRAFT_79439 [Martensiomyces pterosporus]
MSRRTPSREMGQLEGGGWHVLFADATHVQCTPLYVCSTSHYAFLFAQLYGLHTQKGTIQSVLPPARRFCSLVLVLVAHSVFLSEAAIFPSGIHAPLPSRSVLLSAQKAANGQARKYPAAECSICPSPGPPYDTLFPLPSTCHVPVTHCLSTVVGALR